MTNQTCPKLLAECIASGQVSAAQVEAHRVLDAAIAQPEQPAHEVKNSPYEQIKKLCRLYLDDEQGRYRAIAIFTQIFAAAVAAQPEQLNDFTLVPAGWQLVPVEPSDAMLAAGKRETHGNRGALEKTKRIYAEMLRTVSLQNVQPEQTAPVRQPLSDDDIWDIYLPYALSVRHRKSEIQFARAIESAHGIAQPKDKP